MKKFTLFIIQLLFTGITSAATPTIMDINTAESISKIQPTMYGIFFEDINFSADGGLYAEMIKNRSFEFDNPMMGWKQPATDPYALNMNSGIANIISHSNNKSNKRTLHVVVNNDKTYHLINEGFRGMGVVKGEDYQLSFYADNSKKQITSMTFQLIDSAENVIASVSVKPGHSGWEKLEAKLSATRTEEKARLKITFKGVGQIDLDSISLFPANALKGPTKGLRQDLVKLLADLKPGFLRFPGGCIIEGRTLAQRYQWKETLGAVEQRKTMISRWNNEFSHKLTPDYFQTFGLGFYEYFQLAEHLGAEPIPVLSCGIACQFNSGEIVPLAELDPYVRDALDLIEFANGGADTPWGKLRTELGHPEPFNLKYIGIGNEQWGPQYIERFKYFSKVIHDKHPDIILISGSGPFADGEQFDYAHAELKKLNAQIIDEHYYKDITWFKEHANRYDSYDRKGPKIFAGEYAAQSVAILSPENKNSWGTALAEAAFMTGLERNADLVQMSSYAPLMAHVDAWQWSPNLIWFNNLYSLKTANYEIQKLFSNNRGTDLLKITANNEPLIGQDGLFASAVKNVNDKTVTVKVVNVNTEEKLIRINAGQIRKKSTLTMTTLTSGKLSDENSFSDPELISPKIVKQTISNKPIEASIPANSVVMLQFPE